MIKKQDSKEVLTTLLKTNIIETIKLCFNYQMKLHPDCDTIKLIDLFKVLDELNSLDNKQYFKFQETLIEKVRQLK